MNLKVRILLIAPPPETDFGLQFGKGNDGRPVQIQRSTGLDLAFDLHLTLKETGRDHPPICFGPFAQGPPSGRFVYINAGKLAGQADSQWGRRLKVPLGGISWSLIDEVIQNPNLRLEARMIGTDKDRGPSCGTQQPVGGWKVSP